MSIGHIENYPNGPDTVEETDPDKDLTADQGGGVDTDESEYFQRARRHTDPLAKALDYLGAGHSRELDRHAGYEGLLTDPTAPFTLADTSTGTAERPERWMHDQALQVRQLEPTDFETRSVILSANTAQQILWQKPERLGVLIKNLSTTETVYIGKSANIGANGWPLAPGETVRSNVLNDVWAYSVLAASVAVWDQFRTDSAAS